MFDFVQKINIINVPFISSFSILFYAPPPPTHTFSLSLLPRRAGQDRIARTPSAAGCRQLSRASSAHRCAVSSWSCSCFHFQQRRNFQPCLTHSQRWRHCHEVSATPAHVCVELFVCNRDDLVKRTDNKEESNAGL